MSQTNLNDELRRAGADPWLPIESKLVGWSLGVGIALLVLLAVVNRFLPAGL